MEGSKKMKPSCFKEEAYWISPEGKIISIKKSSRHILEVIRNPEKFGCSTHGLRKIFEDFGELYGFEGYAREQIIKALVRKGWIRIRKYIRPDRWTINVPGLSERTGNSLKYWASEMIKAGWGEFNDVYIDYPEGTINLTMGKLSALRKKNNLI